MSEIKEHLSRLAEALQALQSNIASTIAAMRVTVQVRFGESLLYPSNTVQQLEVEAQPGDTVLELKQRVAAAAGGAVTADDLLLMFGPIDHKMGRQYQRDPTVDESKVKLEQYSVLAWLERFPHWTLTGKAQGGGSPEGAHDATHAGCA